MGSFFCIDFYNIGLCLYGNFGRKLPELIKEKSKPKTERGFSENEKYSPKWYAFNPKVGLLIIQIQVEETKNGIKRLFLLLKVEVGPPILVSDLHLHEVKMESLK